MFKTIQAASAAINNVSILAVEFFFRQATEREVEQQRAVFNGNVKANNIMIRGQETAFCTNEEFAPDMECAEDRARTNLEFGVGQRLRGAHACYTAGMQLECLRHILLALGTICHALDWKKASTYINEQNEVLYKMSEKERSDAYGS
ncbi:hypothetical protein H6784_04655 [Candidatus Nomurabacteria bacterium]|nr:hypothetical protein [Candidatus Kaiserbacteria bacterium]MCB9814679.1 hypothetical protein [Candidatus Nomurabacteria bacterium]